MFDPDVLTRAKALVEAGAELEEILQFLRERGYTKFECFKAVRKLFSATVAQAKAMVDNSKTWSDRYEKDLRVRQSASEAIRQLAASNSPDLPKIILDEDEEDEKGD